jgi:iron complex transport system substrate-binding protein
MPSHRGRSPLNQIRAGLYLSLLLPCLAQAQLPSVASINLCTDQLVLTVADPEQILSVSWLAADPEESMFAGEADRYPLNYGSAEELLRIDADIVIAGSETSPFTRQMLRRLGSTIVEVAPATSLDEVARNLRLVGEAIGRGAEAESIVEAMRARADAIRARRAAPARSAVVVRPGGFTIGRDTLAHQLLELAGLDNRIAGLDRWGSLSIETLLTSAPEFIIVTSYRSEEPSLANSFLSHPALVLVTESQTRVEVPARYFSCGAPASLFAAEVLLAQMTAR